MGSHWAMLLSTERPQNYRRIKTRLVMPADQSRIEAVQSDGEVEA
jgi:hypothetical protein